MHRSVTVGLLVLASLFTLVACGAGQGASGPGEGGERRGQKAEPKTVNPSAQEQGTPTASATATQEAVGNIPIDGIIGENIETDSYDLRVLDYFESDSFYYAKNFYIEDIQDYFSESGKFVVVNYSVTNKSPQAISPTPVGRLHAKAGDHTEVYEQSDEIVPAGRSGAELQMDEIAPRQMRVSQFVFDVPSDVEPELLVVTDEPTIDTVFEVGTVDLTREDPRGPRAEEILALQYEYTNMSAWGQAYALFAQETKERITEEEYTSQQEQDWEENPTAISEYSFPSVEVNGDRAIIERVFTYSGMDDEGQDKVTQEAALEDDGWKVVMRDEQYEIFDGGAEATTQ